MNVQCGERLYHIEPVCWVIQLISDRHCAGEVAASSQRFREGIKPRTDLNVRFD
jgi:hypothetical protein